MDALQTTRSKEMPSESRFLLNGVPWIAYLSLRDAEENDHIRMTYDHGALEMMSPSKRHEQLANLLGRLVEAWAEETGVDLQSCRTMTLRREDVERGLESDNCYYIQNEPVMRARTELDLTEDPPPDLAIEVDLGRPALDRSALYAAFGVPELWRYNGRELSIFRLDAQGRYVLAAASEALSGFPIEQATRVVQRLGAASDSVMAKSFRDWVRKNHSPS